MRQFATVRIVQGDIMPTQKTNVTQKVLVANRSEIAIRVMRAAT